jgi:glycogenin glucosyltransferase
MSGQGEPSIVVQHVRGEWQPPAYGYSSSSAYVPPPAGSPPQQAQQPASGSDERAEQWRGSFSQAAQQQPTQVTFADTRVPAIERKPAFEAPFSSWDPSKAPPPAEAGPEAMNFPSSHYEMSHDPAPFKAPAKYPEPPKNMWYDVPKTPTYQKPRPIFPWEVVPSKPTRVFPGEEEYDRRLSVEGLGSPQEASSPTDKAPDGVTMRPTDALEKGTEPAVRDFAHEGSEQSPERTESDEASAPTTPGAPVEPWETFTLRNAWDAIPEIERYISSLQKNRKGNIQVLQGYGAGVAQNANRRSSIITDFPTEVERPSLPVTPAPMRRPSFWGSERDDEGDLPAADGVPNQEEWV